MIKPQSFLQNGLVRLNSFSHGRVPGSFREKEEKQEKEQNRKMYSVSTCDESEAYERKIYSSEYSMLQGFLAYMDSSAEYEVPLTSLKSHGNGEDHPPGHNDSLIIYKCIFSLFYVKKPEIKFKKINQGKQDVSFRPIKCAYYYITKETIKTIAFHKICVLILGSQLFCLLFEVRKFKFGHRCAS